jgi:menaquinone-dependent protoporphyrinogen oxidase
MSRVLLLYGTTDGHTHSIVDAIDRALQLGGLQCDVVEACGWDPVPHNYAAIIVAASVHGGRYQRGVVEWVQRHAAELNAMPAAFVSVSLGILQKSDPSVVADIDAIVTRFTNTTGWTPTVIKHVAGALRYRRYNFFMRWIMKRIAAKAGGDTDTSKDYVYTDWNDLRTFADGFCRRLAAAA